MLKHHLLILRSKRFASTSSSSFLKSRSDTLRGLLLATGASFAPYVDVTRVFNSLDSLSRKSSLTETLWLQLVKKTVFRQFAGGETEKDLVPFMKDLSAKGVGSIVALSVEADLDAESSTAVIELERAREMTSSQLPLIEIASKQPGSFIAIKLTAFYPPYLLKLWSSTLKSTQSIIESRGGSVSLQTLKTYYPLISLSANDISAEFNPNSLTFEDVRTLFSLTKVSRASQLDPFSLPTQLVAGINDEMRRMCAAARDGGVRIIMDAEQTYFQPAIDDLILGFCQEFNAKPSGLPNNWTGPMIYNSYQSYLVATGERLRRDVMHAQKLGYALGVKLVRGAYMEQERQLAKDGNYKSPVHGTLQETHEAYNSNMLYVLDKINETRERHVRPVSLVVASHNKDSVELGKQSLRTLSLPRAQVDFVAFGQLLGMNDSIMHDLAANGFLTYKYVPYGPLQRVIPYLVRRLQENRQMLALLAKDKSDLLKQLWSSSATTASATSQPLR